MDTFTHILLAFVVIGTVDIKLGVFAAFMALFIDLDFVLAPFARKFPVLEHRGVVHAVPIILIYTPIISIFGSLLLGTNYLLTLVAGLSGTLLHVLADSFTTYGIAALWPFKKEHLKLDFFIGIDPFAFIVSIPALAILLSSYYNNNLATFNNMLLFATIYFSIYFLARIMLKILVWQKFHTKSLPSFNWFKYTLIYESNGQEGQTEYKELQWQSYNLLTRKMSPMKSFRFPKINPSPPLETENQFIAYSYKLDRIKRILTNTYYHICRTIRKTAEETVLFWSSIEMEFMGALVYLKPDGSFKIDRIYPYKKIE